MYALRKEIAPRLDRLKALSLIFTVLLSPIISITPHAWALQIGYDNDGVPLVNYAEIENVEIGWQRNPVTISQTGTCFFNMYVATNDKGAKEAFLNNANWLVDNSVPKDKIFGNGSHLNYSLLEYNFQFPPYNLYIVPWHSAMAQGLAADLLIKAHNITGNDAYLTTAKELVDALFIDIDEGGLTYKNDTEGWWYEEYSGEGGWNPRVLNGMLYTLIGIYNFHNYTGDPSANYLFQKGIEGLKQQIHLYDHNQTYSSYDIVGGYAPYGYHRIHVDLLRELYLITQEDTFKKYHDAWGKFILPNQDSPSFYTQIGCQTGQSKEFK